MGTSKHVFTKEGDILGRQILARRVAVVAVGGAIGDWAAYIDAVPGIDHTKEINQVRLGGQKLPKEIAIVIFPELDPLMYRE